MMGYLDVVEKLIADGADVNEQNRDRWNHNPLSYVCYAPKNQAKIVEALVAGGADLDQFENCCGGYTATHVCAHVNATEGLQAMIDAGANLTLKNKGNLTPLGTA